MGSPPRLGSWARSGNLVGVVARVGDGRATLFDPGNRQAAEVPLAGIDPVPAGAVTVTVTVDLPLPHGMDESSVRRWVASLVDETLRERAREALDGAGLDAGPALPVAGIEVAAMRRSGAVCLCGARVPAPPGSALGCPACGREAVAAP